MRSKAPGPVLLFLFQPNNLQRWHVLPSCWKPNPRPKTPLLVPPGTRTPELAAVVLSQQPSMSSTSRSVSQGSDDGLPRKHTFLPPDAFGIIQGAAVGTEPGGLADTALKKKRGGEKLVEKCPLQPSC